MKIWFIKLDNKLCKKSKYPSNLLFFSLEFFSKLTFNLENYRSDFDNLKINITCYLLVIDINYIVHGYFIFYKLSNFRNKDKLIVNLYNIILNKIFNHSNQKAKFKRTYSFLLQVRIK